MLEGNVFAPYKFVKVGRAIESCCLFECYTVAVVVVVFSGE